MYFQYGSYRHPANEVTLASFMVRPKLSPRGRRMSSIYEMHLHGQICENDTANATAEQQQAAIHARIAEIVTAYAYDDKDALFLHDDLSRTRHCLINADSISGVKVLHRSWPKDDPGEYATVRNFYIVLQAEYLEPDSQLIFFQESLGFASTGGPRAVMIDVWNGPPIVQLIHRRTHQRVVQSGYAIGLQGYPLAYINPFYPDWEHVDRRVVVPVTPKSHSNGFTHYPISWTFHFSLPQGQSDVPIPR